MLDIANFEAVVLDHSYCKKTVFDATTTTKKQTSMADKSLNWEEVGVEFHPPSPHADVPLSALSPPHSIDSGFDNEMNFLAELDGMDLDSVLNMDSIFNTDMNANIPNKKQPPDNSKRPTRTVKKARKMDKDDEEDFDKNRKNAIAARENRIKKKKYVEGIETELEELKRENAVLKAKERRYDEVVGKLENQVSYLKNVIANQSTLSPLIQRLVTTPGITFTSNFLAQDTDERPTAEAQNDADDEIIDDDPNKDEPTRTDKVRKFVQTRSQTRGTKRSSPATESSPTGRKKACNDEVKGGVCLHVAQGKVSLEFCSQCSIQANGNSQL